MSLLSSQEKAATLKAESKELVENLRLPFVVLSLLACLGVWAGARHVLPTNALLYYAVLLLKLAGLFVSSLLVWHSLDANNAFLRSICRLNSCTSCSAVLSTPAARLFAWLSWAEVGLFYFGGALLNLLLFHAAPAKLYPLLLGATIAALPYTFWSVYYQWRRARQWCMLCLAVQGLLWLELIVMLCFQQRFSWPLAVSKIEIALFVSGFLPLPAIWALLKPSLKKAARADGLQQRLQSIKFDQHHLASLRQRARILPPISPEMRVPTLGAPDAPHTLVVVTNPTCSVCAQVHLELEELMAQMEDVCCQFIIAAPHQPENVSRAVAAHVLNQPPPEMPVALHQWYTTLDLGKWLKKITLLGTAQQEQGEPQVALHQQWCTQAEIDSTPTIFFNGTKIPPYYTIPEIKKVIRFLTTNRPQFA